MAGARPPLMLLDSASLWFRAFHGVPESVTGPDGTPVNAIRGFFDHVARLLREHRPGRLVACVDADWRPDWRVALVPSYKAHRVAPEPASNASTEAVPDTLAPQVPIIEGVLAAVGIAVVGVDGYEADDVIATMAAADPGRVDVVTGDRDLFQVIRPGVRVLYTVEKGRAYDDAAVSLRYGLARAAQYADLALLRGDPSDGLPGVAGIGAKTAAGLLTRYDSVDALLAALDAGEDVPAAGKLRAARDYLTAAAPVVRVATDVPLPAYDDRLPRSPVDPEGLLAIVDAHGIDGPVERLLAALEIAAAR